MQVRARDRARLPTHLAQLASGLAPRVQQPCAAPALRRAVGRVQAAGVGFGAGGRSGARGLGPEWRGGTVCGGRIAGALLAGAVCHGAGDGEATGAAAALVRGGGGRGWRRGSGGGVSVTAGGDIGEGAGVKLHPAGGAEGAPTSEDE